MKKEKILISDFPDKYYEIPNDDKTVDYVVNGPVNLYQYVIINESTNACEKKINSELKENCYKKIEEKINVKK